MAPKNYKSHTFLFSYKLKPSGWPIHLDTLLTLPCAFTPKRYCFIQFTQELFVLWGIILLWEASPILGAFLKISILRHWTKLFRKKITVLLACFEWVSSYTPFVIQIAMNYGILKCNGINSTHSDYTTIIDTICWQH